MATRAFQAIDSARAVRLRLDQPVGLDDLRGALMFDQPVIAGVLWSAVDNSGASIDWSTGAAMSVLWSGVYAWAFPSLFLFGIPFLIGVCLSRGLRTTFSKKAP